MEAVRRLTKRHFRESHMFGIGPLELVIILVVFVVLFGSKRLPELGTGLGQAITNFRKSFREGTSIDVTPKEEKSDDKKPQP